ncbi:MAG: ABC transporter permease, partial [Limisphaerales bacterium]
MSLLPIVERELRVASRRTGLYWGRAVAGASAMVVAGLLLWFMRGRAPAQIGFSLFVAMGWLAWLAALMAGVRLTADSLSEERREGTLGLLFLTDLRGYDVVLGKLTAAAVPALYQVLAVVPVLTAALLFGGVAAEQIGKVVLVLLVTLYFSLSIGLGISVWFENGRRAAGVTAAVLLTWTLGPFLPTIWDLIHGTGPVGPLFEWQAALMNLSPAAALAMAQISSIPPSAMRFEVSLALLAAAGLAALLLASFMASRVWREGAWWPWRRASRGSLRPGESTRSAAAASRHRRRLIEINPYFWLAARDRWQPAYVWAALGALAVFGVWGQVEFKGDWRDNGGDFLLSMLAHGLLKAWLAFAVVRRLAEDKQNGALELLLTTPLGVERINEGQGLACWRQFAGPVVAVVAMDAVFVWLQLTQSYGDRTFTVLLFFARGGMLVADAVVLVGLGIWVAVNARRPNEAGANLLLQVLVLPWIALLALLVAYQVFRLDRLFSFNEYVALGLWFGLGILNDLRLGILARQRLHSRWREAATQRQS